MVEPIRAPISTGLNVSGSAGRDGPREELDGGDQEDGDLSARGERDLGGELDLSARRDDDGASVLCRVADDRDDHGRDEEVGEPGLLRERLERADERLGNERGDHGGRREHAERERERPRLHLLGIVGHVGLPVAAQREPGDADVDDEEHDRDRQGDHGERVPLRVALQPGTAGIRNSRLATMTSARERRLDQRSSSPLPPKTSEKPSTSRRLPITLPGQRPAHDLGEAVGDREERDDQLGRVPERGVDEPADPRPRVVGGVLGRLADQPGERDQRGGGDDEQRHVADADELEDDDDRRQDERSPEDPPHHAREPTEVSSRGRSPDVRGRTATTPPRGGLSSLAAARAVAQNRSVMEGNARPVSASDRAAAPPAGRGPSADAAGSTARRSSTRLHASSGRARSSYAYEEWGRTYVGCMQKIFDVEIDLAVLEESRGRRDGFGGVRARRQPLPMCQAEVVRCYQTREDELGCLNPEFNELSHESPVVPRHRAARQPRLIRHAAERPVTGQRRARP